MEVEKDHVIKVIGSNGFCGFDIDKKNAKAGENVTFINTTGNPVSIIFLEPRFFEASFLNLGLEQEHTLTVSMDDTAESCDCLVNCNTAGTIEFYTTKPVVIIYR